MYITIIPTSIACSKLNPVTGAELWVCNKPSDYVCPSVIAADGIVYIINSRFKKLLLAIRTGGRGDVSDSHVLWKNRGWTTRVCTPVYHEGHLYAMDQAGYATMAAVGAEVTSHHWGFAQGFDAFFDQMGDADDANRWRVERPGDAVVADATAWLDTNAGTVQAAYQEIDGWNRLHPTEPARLPWVRRAMDGADGPVVAVSDWVSELPSLLARFLPNNRMMPLGTDGFGRSDTRAMLRRHFEVDRYYVTVAALKALADEDKIPLAKVSEAIAKYGLDPDKPPLPWLLTIARRLCIDRLRKKAPEPDSERAAGGQRLAPPELHWPCRPAH